MPQLDTSTDGDFVLLSAVGKGKVVGAGATTVVSTPGHIDVGGDVQIWTKTWRKALVDENKDSEDIDDSADDSDDADRPLDVGVAR